MRYLILLFLLFLVGCVPPSCPELKCPAVKCPEPEVIDESLYVYFIDVGHGDAQLIKYKDTEMLIDCGKNLYGPRIVEFLRSKGITNLEFLMITHPDSDALGGCDDVLHSIPTDVIITNGDKEETASYREVHDEIDDEQMIEAKAGDIWNIGPATMEVIQSTNLFDDSNKNSVVSRLTLGETSVLFTGDCYKDCEDMLLDKDIGADILKVAYHGTKFSTGLLFLEKVNPQTAIITLEKDNDYGHPSPETLDRLSQEGVVVYRTDLDGDIIIKINEGFEIVR